MKINIKEAKSLLLSGKVVAIPTETVYGLAALATNLDAVRAIFALKGRPSHNPLILHIAKPEECLHYAASIPSGLESLMAAFWPGPLTLVLPIKEELVLPEIRANLKTAAFRMPKHELALSLLNEVSPLVAPSANLSGAPSSTRREHVEADFGKGFPVLDGGRSLHGLESTILVYSNERWQIARLGAISQERLKEVLGYIPEIVEANAEKPICPGQLLAHYAPKARLILSTDSQNILPAVIGFGDRLYPHAKKVFLLSEKCDANEAAHRLYTILRQLDQENIQEAWVDMQFPETGLWKTVRERLSRAASR